MKDKDKTKEQLIGELAELRRRVSKREAVLQENSVAAALLQIAPLGIHECDTEGRITFVNPSQEVITGFTGDELLGTYVWDRIVPGPDRDSLPAYFKHLVSDQPPPTPYITKNVRKNGEVFEVRVDWNYNRNPQGQVTGFVCIVSDITEQKRRETALRNSEERFRRVFEDGPIGVALIDLDARIQHVNRRFCEMLGYSENEIVALGLPGITHPEDYEPDHEVRMRLLSGEVSTYTIEKRYVRKDGQVIWGRLTASMIHNSDSKASLIIGMVEDITQGKQAEEALQKAHDELGRQVAERTAELSRSKSWLEEAQRIARIGNWEWDSRTNEVLWSDEMYRIFGVSKVTFHGNFEEHLKLIPSEDREEYLAGLNRVLAGKEQWNREHRILFSDGTIRYVWASGSVRNDAEGNIIGLVGTTQDITERKAADEVLRESEERFRITFETAPVGMVIGVGDGIIVKANRALCRMGGYTEEELIGRHVRDLAYPEDRELGGPLVKKLLAGEIPSFTQEKRYLRKDGQIFWAQATTAAAHDPDGNIAFALGVVEDITDRKRAEEALRQSHEQLQTIFDGMFDGLLIVDVETKRFVRVNSSICRKLGYSESELLSMSIMDIHPAEEVPEVLARLQARSKGRFQGSANVRIVRKDGTVRYADIASHVLTYNGRPCIAGFFRDVTERMVAEEALRQSHQHFQAVCDGMVDGFVIFDIENFRTLRANSALCNMLGYTEEEIKALSPEQKHPVDSHAKIKAHYEAVVQGRESRYDAMPCIRKDGNLLYLDVLASQISYEGRPCQLLFFHDVTERKHAHDALQKERRTLKHMLRASDHERQLIAYDIHDGLAQQLAGAIMQFQFYAHVRDTTPKEADKAFDVGMAMLQQSHFEARRLISGVRPLILDESGVLAAIAHLIHEPAFDQGSRIDFRSRVTFHRLAPIFENVVYRIVQEGLTNARNHSKSQRIVVSLIQRTNRLRIEIRDWGVGFDPNEVYESGFGLKGIRERARLLKGKSSVKSKPGKGTSIIVELPILERKST